MSASPIFSGKWACSGEAGMYQGESRQAGSLSAETVLSKESTCSVLTPGQATQQTWDVLRRGNLLKEPRGLLRRKEPRPQRLQYCRGTGAEK
jgi:hypothetical protein